MFSAALRYRPFATRAFVRTSKGLKPARRLASTTPGPWSASAEGVGYAVAAGLAVVSGAAGYAFASRSSAVADVRAASPARLSTPTYGTKEDYQKAIAELREVLGGDEDRVSTDEGDLETHGFSFHDPHPGTHSIYPEEEAGKADVGLYNSRRTPAFGGGLSSEHKGRRQDCEDCR
jgi:hypothetical protein